MRPNAHAESKHRRKPPLDIVDDRVVMTRMTPWSPAQGPGSDAPLNASGDDGVFRIDTSVEGPWVPRHLSGDRTPIVQIVDGVRRVEAYAVSDTTSGAAAPALFGSYAVGVVRCEPNRATVLTDPGVLRVERCYLQAGSHAEDLLVRVGQTELCFRASPVPHARKASDLVRELTSRMLAAEARLTKKLSADCGALTLVDGPLRARTTGRRVAGYIKRTANWYLGAEERAIFDDLDVGDRTPLFRLSVEGQTKRDRFSWYVRIADLGPHLHPLASVMRLETWATLPVEQATRLADECALTLPSLAGSLVRDPRAPQNLTPVSGLEDRLRHLLGNRDVVRRRIAVALAERASQGITLITRKGAGV